MDLRRWISGSAREIAFGIGAIATGGAICGGAACGGEELSSEPLPPGSSSSSSSGNLSSNGGPCGEQAITLAIDRTCAGDASSPRDAGICAEPTASCETVCARSRIGNLASCDFGAETLDGGDAGDADAEPSDAATFDGGTSPDVVRCRVTLYCGGRSYDGAAEREAPGVPDQVDLGRAFAEIAELEWTSVTAFERLARALAHHGAPEELVSRAARFADDERRHTSLVAELARAHGGTPDLRAPTGHETTPSLRSLAEENAAEGCVRETLGALVAQVQALRSSSAAVRGVFGAVAEDEARHAELSWDLHAWFLESLAGDDRAHVEAALSRAFASLAQTEPPRLSSEDAGVFGFDAHDHQACVARLGELRA